MSDIEQVRQQAQASWKDIILGKYDSETPSSDSSSAQPLASEKSSAQRWRARAERVLKILEERGQQYGEADALHATLAQVWGGRLGVELSAGMVMLMLIDLKTVRAENRKPSQDTLDDIVGYALLYGDERDA